MTSGRIAPVRPSPTTVLARAALLAPLLVVAAAVPARGQKPAPNQPPSIASEPTPCTARRVRPKLCAFVLDDKGVGQVRAVFRAGGSRHYYWTAMSFDGARYCAWLPAPTLATTTIEYYVEAFDDEYEMSRGRSETIVVGADCPSSETPPETPATVRPAAPDQPPAPPGFDPASFR